MDKIFEEMLAEKMIKSNMSVKIIEEFWREPVKKGEKILNYVFIIEKI